MTKFRYATHSRLYVLLIGFLSLSIGYNLILPIVDGTDADEAAHFQYIRFIVKNHRLPSDLQERDDAGYVAAAGYPPLYQGLAGVLFSGTETGDVSFLNEEWPLVRESMSGPWIFETTRMNYPYQGDILLWHLSRFLSSLFGVGTILVTYFITLELFPGRKELALLAAAILAFIPRFVFMSSIVTDDSLLAFIMALYLLAMIRLIRGVNIQPRAAPQRMKMEKGGGRYPSSPPACGAIYKGDRNWRSFALVGLPLGLAIVTKFTVALIPLTTVLLLCFLAWRQGWSLLVLLKGIAVIALAAFLMSGWWFIFVVWRFSDIETLGWVTGIFNAIVPQVTTGVSGADLVSNLPGAETSAINSYIDWLIYFTQSFWEVRLIIIDDFLLLGDSFWLVWVAGGGLIMGILLAWRRFNEFQRICMILLLMHILAFVPLMLVRQYLTDVVKATAQGRHVLMPAAAAVAVLLGVAWSYWVRSRSLRWLRPILPGILLFWSVTQLYSIYYLFPKPLPISLDPTTRTRVPQVDVAVNRVFFDAFELVGYSARLLPGRATLAVTLVWESHTPALKDYLTEIRLLDQSGQPVSGWVGHPAKGVYPTRAWWWGNMIYDEIRLPTYDLPPGDYTLEAYLVDAYQRPLHRLTDPVITTPVTLEESAKRPYNFKKLLVETGNGSVEVKYQIWPFDFFNFSYPRYHYRATIPIAWIAGSSLELAQQTISLKLVAPDGRVFGPLQEQSNLKSFIVDPNWPAGLYRLKAEVIQDDKVIGENISPYPIKVENIPRQFEPPPMTHRVDANFYNTIKLLGYDLSGSRLQPGGVLTILAHWESLQIVNQHLKIYSRLYDINNNVWVVSDHDTPPPNRGGTLTWVPGQVVSSESKLWLDPKVPNGLYNVHYGLYFEAGDDNQVHLPLVIDGQISDITHITIGPVKVGGPPANILALDVEPQYRREQSLADIIKLNGYDFNYLADTQEIKLTLYWQSLALTGKNYTVFAHLQNDTGQIIAQKDNPPVNGIYPTSLWDVGEVVKDEFVLTLPADFSMKNNASLLVGMYDAATGERLPTVSDPTGNAITLMTFDAAGVNHLVSN